MGWRETGRKAKFHSQHLSLFEGMQKGPVSLVNFFKSKESLWMFAESDVNANLLLQVRLILQTVLSPRQGV